MFRFATIQGQNIHWLLRRNCSISPQQLGWTYLGLCVVSLGIGTMFWLLGATLILPFAWAELLAVGFAFFIYARHATDGEKIHLFGSQLVVELENGGKLKRAEFRRDWVRVEPLGGEGSLIELSGQGSRSKLAAMCGLNCVLTWPRKFVAPCGDSTHRPSRIWGPRATSR